MTWVAISRGWCSSESISLPAPQEAWSLARGSVAPTAPAQAACSTKAPTSRVRPVPLQLVTRLI